MRRKNTSAHQLDKLLLSTYTNFQSFLNKNLRSKKFVVGVSGGPDSLALAYLSKLYSSEKKINFICIVIDHGVRRASGKEAEKVKKLLQKKGIQSHIFKIDISKLKNFHLEARQLRYDKIAEFCKKKKIKYVLLGHHLDDQIENFYIRLSRGSGLTGLSPIKKVSKYKKHIFLRPFLSLRKRQLIKISKKYFNFYLKDTGNFNNKYLRSRVRKLRSFMEEEGFGDLRLLKTLDNFDKAGDALNFYSQTAKKKFINKQSNFISISKKLFNEPYEIVFRCISSFLTEKKDYPPRSKGITRLIADLSQSNKKKVTLGGYIFENGLNLVKVKREFRKC
ncbi:MAG: tRNA lysidine(34) synthetase TilS [Candidatus Pelagibacter sp.]|nr:tRNA lysidine(34) synthetase TilS [Candidatus Pelagibacter sp.]|tara:strand:- start:745 stop:1746 length:1002 start_codon:yes stop_codon:yes gene_type:complete